MRKLCYGSIDEESSSLTPSKLEEEQKTSLIKLNHTKSSSISALIPNYDRAFGRDEEVCYTKYLFLFRNKHLHWFI